MVDGSHSGLRRSLGLFDATAIGLGAIIGGGIFIVTGIVAGIAGPALIMSIVIAAFISMFTALSFVELTRRMPAEGGVYEYASRLLSPFAGFLGGWMWIVSNTFAGSAVSLGFSHYFVTFFPWLDVRIVAAVICVMFTALNYVGVRHSATFNNVLVVAKVCILLLFVAVGLFHIDDSYFSPFLESGISVFYGAFFIFFAFSGFARVAVLGEEVRDAPRIVPESIILSLAISTVLYISVGVVAVGLVGAQSLGSSSSPLALAISSVGYPPLVYVVSLGGMFATASVLLTSILGVSRMIYAMSRRGDLPSTLNRIDPKYDTPYRSIFIVGAAMTVIALAVDLAGVVAVSTFASLFYYSLANASALRMKGKDKGRLRIYSAVGLLTCLILSSFVQLDTLMIGAMSLLIGIFFFITEKKFTFFKKHLST